MAKMYPPEIKGEIQKGERKVFESLRDNLSNEYSVIYSRHKIKVEDGVLRENEGDFIIYNRKKGILVVEVKDSEFSFDRNRGYWVLEKQLDQFGQKRIMAHQGPWVQAEIEKSELYHTIKYNNYTSNLSKNGNCKILFAVWVLQASSKSNLSNWPSDADPAITLFADDLLNPGKKIEEIFNIELKTPTYKDKNTGLIKDGKEIVTNLTQEDENNLFDYIFFPEANIISRGAYNAALNSITTIQLLKEQTLVLEFTEQNKTVAINGAAGTGKTLVAVEKAKRLASQGDTVLFLCFNVLLRDHLNKEYSYKNVSYKTIDKFISDDLCDGKGVNYNQGLERLVALCNNDSQSLPYKHIIIDEGQDFAVQQLENQDILNFLYEVIKSRDDDSCFYIFYDELQKVNGANKNEDPEYIRNAQTKVTLLTNCRNTKNIAMASLKPILVSKYNEQKERIEEEINATNLPPAEKLAKINRKKAILLKSIERRQNNIHGATDGERPEMIFVEGNDINKLRDSINKTIKNYLSKNSKNSLSDIALLTCMSRESTLFEDEMRQGSWKYQNNKIPFTTTSVFKGLESKFVILIEVYKKTFTDYAMSYYVGASRAKNNLSIIANLTEDESNDLIINWLGNKLRGSADKRAIFASYLKCKEVFDR